MSRQRLWPLALWLTVLPPLASAAPAYWNVFNIEEETAQIAQFVTYGTLADMLNDENRLDVFNPDGFTAASVGNNIVGSGSDGSTFWNVFNIEEETAQIAQFVTYATLTDMLNDENRLDVFNPDGFTAASVGNNIVGAGSDGSNYWSVFNIEEETAQTAQFVTYATLTDMLNDENRLDVFNPDGFTAASVGNNIVGSGSDGSTYWNVFNIEEETAQIAQFVTYATLDDMLNDENRLDVFNPDGFTAASVGNNIVGSGALVLLADDVPAPPALTLLAFGLGCLGVAALRRRVR